ncbi:MAG TPA: hypothetical protein DCW42_02620 [Bacteroidetes bacterium]|nr:hypothetical protein [Bacteroidota bacterium]
MSLSRLDQLRMVDPVLTNIAQGYTPSNFIGEKLFPIVKVNSQKGKVPKFGKDAFVVRNSERAIRSNSNRIPTSDYDTIEFTLRERDLEVAMDYIEELETYDELKYEQKLTRDLLDLLALEREKAIADYVQNPLNFDSSSKKILQAGESFNGSSDNPLTIINDAIEQLRENIGRKPNIIVMGMDTYRAIENNFALGNIIQNAGNLKFTYQMLQESLGIKNIYIGTSVYSEDGRIFQDIWKDNLIMAFVDQSERSRRTQYNPSYGYTFQREGMPEIDSYYENGGKIKVIRATDNWEIKAIAPEAAFLINDTIQI